MNRKLLVGSMIVTVILAGLALWNILSSTKNAGPKSFAECVAAGHPILKSFPEQCRTPGGRRFVNDKVIGTSGSITAQTICLPPKETKGPQTTECAYGLKTADNALYALSDRRKGRIAKPVTGTPVTVTGTYELSDTNSKYDIVGIIQISEMEKL